MAAVTAPGDTGRHWYRFRTWRRTAPARWAHTPFRRALLVVVLVALADGLDRAVTNPYLWGLLLVALWTWLGVVADAWNRQVADAAAAPTPPPEPVYTAILAAPYDPSELAPHVLAGWDRIAAGVTAHARSFGIDVDDPYTLTVMAAALVMAESYAERYPVTVDAAVRLHETAWKVRLRELDRHGDPSPAPK